MQQTSKSIVDTDLNARRHGSAYMYLPNQKIVSRQGVGLPREQGGGDEQGDGFIRRQSPSGRLTASNVLVNYLAYRETFRRPRTPEEFRAYHDEQERVRPWSLNGSFSPTPSLSLPLSLSFLPSWSHLESSFTVMVSTVGDSTLDFSTENRLLLLFDFYFVWFFFCANRTFVRHVCVVMNL